MSHLKDTLNMMLALPGHVTDIVKEICSDDRVKTTGQLLLLTAGLTVSYYSYQLIVWYRRIQRIGAEVDKLPGPKKDWIVGNLLQHPGPNEKGLKWIIQLNEIHGGKTFRHWLGPFRPAVVLTHPDTVKLLLKTAEPKPVCLPEGYRLLKPWLGDGLLISGGAKWQRNRKLLTPAFHFDVLKPYMKIYNDSVDALLNKWKKQLEKDPGSSIEICKPVSLLTLDIILKCACSYESNVQENEEKNTYISDVLSLADMIVKRFFTIHYHPALIYNRTSHGKKFRQRCDNVHTKAEEIIAQRKRDLKNNRVNIEDKKHKDFLDILLLARDENGEGLSDLEIRDEVDTFLFEGHDTTSSAIYWCMYNLASHPEIQQRAFEEVDGIFSKSDSTTLIWDDLGEMSYLTMCVKESLRKNPPVPFVNRQLTTPLEIEGVTLLPGTIMAVIPWAVHHNREVWGEDHMDYRPERFDSENLKNMDSHAFIPFSAGPRNCIGQTFAMHEVKTTIAKILHSYRMEVDAAHPVELFPELILRAKYGIKIHFFSRK